MALTYLIAESKQLDATVVKSRSRQIETTKPALYWYAGEPQCWACITEHDSGAWRDEGIYDAELSNFGREMLGDNAEHGPTLEALSSLEKAEYFTGTYCPPCIGIKISCSLIADGMCMSKKGTNHETPKAISSVP